MDDIHISPFIFLSLISLFLLRFVIKSLSKHSHKNSPPSPPKLPILGNLHQLGPLPHQSLHSLARKHGPLMLLHFGSVPVLIVSSAEAASEIFRTHDITFSDRPQYKAFKKFSYNFKTITFSGYSEYWRKVRSIFIIHLLSNKMVKSFRSIREEETAHLVRKVGETASGSVNLSELFAEFTNDLVSRSAFGTKYREFEKGKKLVVLVMEILELLGRISIGDFIPWLGWMDWVSGFDGKLNRVAKEVDEFVEDVIQDRIEYLKEKGFIEKNGENFVDIMLQIHNDDVSIGRDTIKALVMEWLEAGTDTISTAMEWMMAELLQHPTVMAKLQNEVRDIVKDKQDITDEDIDKMHYLKAVIKETLRYHPPISIVPRVVRKDVKIKGYDISTGTIVMINVWTIGRDQMFWDEPEKFRPERFLHSSVDFKGLNFELIPFGAGRRGCPGMTYGVAAIELLLANLMLKFNWKLPDGEEGKDLDMSECPGLAIHRLVPLLAVATKTK